MAPEMELVESSSVEAVGFAPETNELWIRYEGGATYVYSPVPRSVHRELLDSGSIGRYINQHIKPRFGCREV
jgi:hypothetical protein